MIDFIPAIDIIDGKCVRLFQGDYQQQKTYKISPEEMAKVFFDNGVYRIHIVDLDGAKQGKPVHHQIVSRIANQYPDKIIEVGGGIRDADWVRRYIDSGVKKVILGSVAISQPHFVRQMIPQYPQQLVIGLDCRNDRIATHGWMQDSGQSVFDYLTKMAEDQLFPEIIFTDIATDGTLEGPALLTLDRLCQQFPQFRFIASGGVSTLADIQALIDLKQANLIGIISGKAIYEQRLDIAEAVRVCSLK